MRKCPVAALVLPISASLACAQIGVHGNGIPSAYVENTPGIVGRNLSVGFGSPTTPNGIAVVSISGSFAPFQFPFAELGPSPLGLDPLDPAYQVYFFGLDGNGHGSVTVPTPPFFFPWSPPLFVDTVTIESATQWSVSKTARIDWMTSNVWEQVSPLGAPRQLHTATAVGSGPRDNRTEVLICGGATGSIILPVPTATAELYSPLTRTTIPLPNMALPRASHQTVRLPSSLLLITGGVTTGGVVTANCEFFDPNSRVFFPAPPMHQPRAGHALTLLDDARVLVSGGVADWQNAATRFTAVLNSAQATAEIFDFNTQTWTQLPSMSSPRFGHTQTKLLDGRVLVVCGIRGGGPGIGVPPPNNPGEIPYYALSCDLFDPTTNSFAPTAQNISATGFHAASLLPNGDVLVTGGFTMGGTYGAATATNVCQVWSNGAWNQVATLPVSAAMHTQVPFQGRALVVGGFGFLLSSLSANSMVAVHDGTAITALADVGLGVGAEEPRAAHTCTVLADGTVLVYGGTTPFWTNGAGNSRTDGMVFAR